VNILKDCLTGAAATAASVSSRSAFGLVGLFYGQWQIGERFRLLIVFTTILFIH
jgi:hypothetical protein